MSNGSVVFLEESCKIDQLPALPVKLRHKYRCVNIPLGRGGFGDVRLVEDISLKKRFAAKVIQKSKIKDLDLDQKQQITVLNMAKNHPNIITLIEVRTFIIGCVVKYICLVFREPLQVCYNLRSTRPLIGKFVGHTSIFFV